MPALGLAVRVAAVLLPLALVSCDTGASDLTLCFAGDLLLDRGVRLHIERKGPQTLVPVLAHVLGRTDICVANLECPVTEHATPVKKRFVFRGEPAWLDALRQGGITHLGLANNHSVDHGRTGLQETAAHIRAFGMTPLGFGTTHEAACEPHEIVRNGRTVAIFSSVLLPLENWMYLPATPSICQATAEQLSESIEAYRGNSPTAFVIAMVHWGVEYRHFPTDSQRRQAARMVSAGADMIVGHHPHVIQSIEYVRGTPVFYSLGNFFFDSRHPASAGGILAEVHLSDTGAPRFVVRPYTVEECMPVPLTKESAEQLKQRILSFSEGITLADSQGGWHLLPEPAGKRRAAM